MIASRKLPRLQNTATELQQYLPSDGTAELDFMECNIRNESQVLTIRWLISVILTRVCVLLFIIITGSLKKYK